MSLLFQFCVEKSVGQTTVRDGRIVAFHPSAGNSITLPEKKEFGIFTEYNDSLFESAQLFRSDSLKYTIFFKTTAGKSFERDLSLAELDAIYKKIESVKPFASVVTPSEEDYVVNNYQHSKEEEAKSKWNKTGYVVAEITLQVLFVFLEILANSH